MGQRRRGRPPTTSTVPDTPEIEPEVVVELQRLATTQSQKPITNQDRSVTATVNTSNTKPTASLGCPGPPPDADLGPVDVPPRPSEADNDQQLHGQKKWDMTIRGHSSLSLSR